MLADLRRLGAAATLLAVVSALAWAVPSRSESIPERTFLISAGVNNTGSNGQSTRPTISGDGRYVVFDSTAANLTLDGNGAVRDVFIRDLVTNATAVVSDSPEGTGANRPSSHGVIAADRLVVAFASQATNLVVGDDNGQQDIFVRRLGEPLVRVSSSAATGDANGVSRDPDLSADGTVVAFSSTATNLGPGDTNAAEDIFIHDSTDGSITRVAGGDGPSRLPAVSGNGRYVSFTSEASDLVRGDTNGVADVFVYDRDTGRVERVTVSSRERQQNRAVEAPFLPVSDINRTGRYVTFDSDASNLVTRDLNKDTDIFVRDRKRGITGRASIDRFFREGNNDSFNPSFSPDGNYIAFTSFASNLAPGDGAREDVFVYDFKRLAPTVMTVGHEGQERGREVVRQLLQRAALSERAQLGVFTSTASNLVEEDENGLEDVFTRVMTAPALRVRTIPSGTVRQGAPYSFSADDPRARNFLCDVDRIRFPCGRSGRLPLLPRGAHTLHVWAGGAGMLYQARSVTRRIVVR